MKQEKQFLLDELQQLIQDAGSFLLVQYTKLDSKLTQDFRRRIKKSGGDVQVARKRVLSKSVIPLGIDLSNTALPGHIAVVLTGSDPLETTKVVYQFGKEFAQVISVQGGHLYGQLYDASDVERLSQLPDLDGMRAQLLGTLEAPMSHTLATMDAILCSVMHCLENKSKQMQAPAEEQDQE
jgi:large subunit ribosomal protein L10